MRSPFFSGLFLGLFVSGLLIGGASCARPNPPGGGAASDGGASSPPLAGLRSIAISPADQTLVVSHDRAASSGYRAVGQFSDGHREDVTARVLWNVGNTALGLFHESTFTTQTTLGGSTTVLASSGSVVGTTGLTLLLRERVRDPGSLNLPPDPSALFGGAPGANGPALVYPNDGVLVPPNLGKLEFHFKPAAGNSIFELSFQNSFTDIKVYQRCATPMNGGCIYSPDAATWRWLSDTNRGQEAVQVSIKGTDDAGSAVGGSPTISISIALDEVSGGLYYWTTSNGTGIMRFDFASPTQTSAEKFMGTELSGGACVGCHALSRDGAKMIAEAGGQNDGRLLLVDVAKILPMVPFGQPQKSIFESWSPDGSRYVGVYGDSGATDFNLQIFDGASGQLLQTVPGSGTAANPADHPDWSPDGKSIAYVKVGVPNTLQRMFMGAIEIVSAQGPLWSAPRELVPAVAGKNHYYPAFSPEGGFIVYDESTCISGNQGGECNADTDPSARLYAVAIAGGGAPVELARANARGATDATTSLYTSFPKWSPFVFKRTGEAASKVTWITFSSTRNYGLRTPPPSTEQNGQSPTGTLLWMAAVDPDQVAAGIDPSSPAFALPFQDLTTSNHIAQWTTKIVPPIQ